MMAPSTITTGAVIGRLLTANPVATSVGIRINTRMESRSFIAELLGWCVRAQERTPSMASAREEYPGAPDAADAASRYEQTSTTASILLRRFICCDSSHRTT